MSSELVPVQSGLGIPSSTIDRLRGARALIEAGGAEEIVDVLVYSDAIASIAREKRAASVAREAIETRILAAKRLGDVLAAKTDAEREALWGIIPGRFSRCEELASIPPRLFKRAIRELLEKETTCSITGVIRRAQLASLQRIEDGIYTSHNGEFWIKGLPGKGRRDYTHVHHGTLEIARKRLQIRSNRHVATIDSEYSSARMAASRLSGLGHRLRGEPRKLVAQAELQQAKVAELLDSALREYGVTG